MNEVSHSDQYLDFNTSEALGNIAPINNGNI